MWVKLGAYSRVEHLITRVGSILTWKHYTRLERPARDEHSSLVWAFVNYGCKKFYHIELLSRVGLCFTRKDLDTAKKIIFRVKRSSLMRQTKMWERKKFYSICLKFLAALSHRINLVVKQTSNRACKWWSQCDAIFDAEKY